MVSLNGHLSLRAALRPNGRTALVDQSFRAPYHVSKPYWDHAAETLLVQVVNPTAGILAGDQLRSEVMVDDAASLLLTTPSASRVFRMHEGAAQCTQRFGVGDGGWLEVMPEPLVPHRGSRFSQRTVIDVSAGGSLFYADILMPGRSAHGETWSWETLTVETEVRVNSRLVLRERFAQSPEQCVRLAELAGSGPATCFANAVLIGTPARPAAPWRQNLHALHGDGVWIGVSALMDGGWTIKFLAPDGARLRRLFREVRAVLREAFPRLACDPRKL